MKYWHNGIPYVAANVGYDPGTTTYWNSGTPYLDSYPADVSFSKVASVATASIKSVASVTLGNIKKVANV